jgi:Leucine-rich repeat (LRR) protein
MIKKVPERRRITLDASHFSSTSGNIVDLSIDFNHDSDQFQIRIKHDALRSLKNLKTLYLSHIHDLNKIPNLDNSHHIKEITIHESNLRQVSTEFCAINKKFIQKLDFSMNDLSDLRYVFDECLELKLLDLSYNRIESLNEMFNNEDSNLLLLNLDGNMIEHLSEADLMNLGQLTELSLRKNRLKTIHPKAFDSLINLIKITLSKNELLSEIPPKSPMYNSVQILDMQECANLIQFPTDANQFLNIKELKLNYAYHCCPFQNKKKNTRNKQFKIERYLNSNDLNFVHNVTNNNHGMENVQFLVAEKFENEDNEDSSEKNHYKSQIVSFDSDSDEVYSLGKL